MTLLLVVCAGESEIHWLARRTVHSACNPACPMPLCAHLDHFVHILTNTCFCVAVPLGPTPAQQAYLDQSSLGGVFGQSPDVVYRIRHSGAEALDVTISTCGSSFDTILALASEDLEPPVFLTSDDNPLCASNPRCAWRQQTR